MLRLVVALAFLCPATVALSAPVVVTFEGVVTDDSITPSDDFGLLPPIVPGDRFTGRYTYDDDVAPLVFPSPSGVAYRYEFSSLPFAGFDVEINGRSYSFTNATPARIPFNLVTAYVEDSQSGLVFSRYDAQFLESSDATAGVITNEVFMRFTWEQPDFPSDPLSLPNLDTLQANQFFFTLRYEAEPNFGPPIASSRFAGEITSIQVIPEPSTVTLLTPGLCVLLAARRYSPCRRPR
jgi:hypothetical protein